MVIGVVTYPMLIGKEVEAEIIWLVVIVIVFDDTEQEFIFIPVMVHNDNDEGTDTYDAMMNYILPPFSI